MEARKKKRGFLSRKAIRFVCIVFPACSLTILFLAVYWLPELTYSYKELRPCSSTRIRFFTENQPLGKLGEMMIAMLPQELAFKVFVPSERAFECDLRLHLNISLSSDLVNDTDVVITRVLSFSTIPRLISSNAMVPGAQLRFFVWIHLVYIELRQSNAGCKHCSVGKRRGEIVVCTCPGWSTHGHST